MTRIEDEGRRPISALLPAGTDTAQAVLDAGADITRHVGKIDRRLAERAALLDRVAELAQAVSRQEAGRLTKVPGIGKKTAERLVLELRDKLDLPGLVLKDAEPKQLFDAGEEDVISALMNFGAARPAAEAAVRKAKAEGDANDFDNLFRRALRLVR